MEIEEYIEAHISPEPPLLSEVVRDTYLYHLYPRMCSGHLQGRLLKMLVQMIEPRRILELGTFTGYSALCMAEGMPPGAVLHTVEIDPEAEDGLRATFARSGRAADIVLHIGDALMVVPGIDEEWDLVFIDANKRNYIDYYNMVLPRLRPGGYIFADNTLWSDKVADPAKRDAQTMGIEAFNDMVAADPRVEVVIVPLRDGMTLIRKKLL